MAHSIIKSTLGLNSLKEFVVVKYMNPTKATYQTVKKQAVRGEARIGDAVEVEQGGSLYRARVKFTHQSRAECELFITDQISRASSSRETETDHTETPKRVRKTVRQTPPSTLTPVETVSEKRNSERTPNPIRILSSKLDLALAGQNELSAKFDKLQAGVNLLIQMVNPMNVNGAPVSRGKRKRKDLVVNPNEELMETMLETLRTKKCHSASGSIAMLVEKAGFRQKLETHTVAPLGNEGAVKEGMAFFPTEETDAVIAAVHERFPGQTKRALHKVLRIHFHALRRKDLPAARLNGSHVSATDDELDVE